MIYEYNTQRKGLVLPEYGRNVQKMVLHAMSLEDREERNRCAQSIVQVMANINPNFRDNPEYKRKLWDHLAIISDFKLDVDYPYEIPTPDILYSKPNQVGYCQNRIRYKHYGRTVELMIKKAIEMQNPEEKEILVNLIANHMKRLYLTWNNDSMVNDDVIFSDLEELSGGKLNVDRNMKLSDAKNLKTNTNPANTKRKQKSGNNNYRKR